MTDFLNWHMGLLFVYAAFLLLILMGLIENKQCIALIGIPFALLFIPLDMQENFALLNITSALGNTIPIDQMLIELHTDTWLKRGALCLTLAAISLALLKNKESVASLISGIFSISIVDCWVSNDKPEVAEIMGLLLLLFLFVLTINETSHAWKISRKNT